MIVDAAASCLRRMVPVWPVGDDNVVESDEQVGLLLIDDEPEQAVEQLRRSLPRLKPRVHVACSGDEGIAYLSDHPAAIVLLELSLRGECGLEVLRRIRNTAPRAPVIALTREKAPHSAIEAMKLGALDYLAQPLAAGSLQRALQDAREIVRHREVILPLPAPLVPESDEVMCGSSQAMLEVYKAIGRVADQDVTVLITGESGTGKELVARAICRHSARSGGPFLALNCAAIPGPLLESELFGHEKGAFTGADRRRIGKFEQCRGGTLLLDEIGDMPLDLQAKILRVIQERTFQRVGGSETIEADVRIIASTHRDLRLRAADERFRADLYYRLSVFTIELPPLRERKGDLRDLIQHYLTRFNRELGRGVMTLSSAASDALEAHSWPGNIRELQSTLKIALLNAHGHVLLPSFLPALKPLTDGDAGKPRAFDLDSFLRMRLSPEQNDLYAEIRAQVDRAVLSRVLAFTQGNQRNAAHVLGISRQTLRAKMRTLGMSVSVSVDNDGELSC